ncbi:MAG: hypothetical protein LBU88_07035 [Treponema sp.]|nr:hypothetical protein [Treponema sp.]
MVNTVEEETVETAEVDELLKEAIRLGILNIDFDGDALTPEILRTAIRATKRLHDKLDDSVIAKKIQEADLLALYGY